MKKFLTIVVLLVTALWLQPMVVGAQTVTPNRSAKRAISALADFRSSEGLIIDKSNSTVQAQIKAPNPSIASMNEEFLRPYKIPNREGVKENKVTIRFLGDACPNPFVRFYDKENIEVTGDILFSELEEDINTWTYQVPNGIYDIMIGWKENVSDVVEKHRCFVAWEGKTIDSDQEIVLSADDAPNSVRFNYQLPNGEPVKWPGVMVDESGDVVRDWTDANVGMTKSGTMVCHAYYGPLQNEIIIFNCGSDGSLMEAYHPERDCMIWVNDLPESMWITQHIVMESEHGEVYSVMASTKVKSDKNVVEVGCEGYYEIEEDIEHTPFAFSEVGGGELVGNYTISELVCDVPGMAYQLSIADKNQYTLYVKNDSYEVEGVNVTYTPVTFTSYDWEIKTSSFLGESVTYMGVKSPEIVVKNGGLSYLNTYWEDFSYNYLFSAPIGGYEIFPGLIPRTNNTHPIFSYPAELRCQKLGDNAPILSVVTIDYGSSESRLPITFPAIKGRYGESRIIDLSLLEATLSIGDDKLYEGNYDDYVGWMFSDYMNAPSGSVEVVYTDNNVSVDGLAGKNLTEIGYEKDGEDVWAPTLQMLHFRDNEGFVTDRFGKADDGMLEFAGGDFIEHYNDENYYWYTEEEAVVEVEYAPYGSDEFLPLMVEEVPELYFMPGYGHFYRGTLSSVDRISETGWFDLRIKLTDKAGNYQRQLISPAFKIENLSTGISSTASDEMGVRVDGRNIITPAGSVIYTTQGVVSNSSSVAPGIYIVQTPAGVRKVAVR